MRVHKEALLESLDHERGPLRRYQDFFVGSRSLGALLKYELAHVLASPLPGAPGYLLRQRWLGGLLGHVGAGVQFGRGVSLRHPGKMAIGEHSAIDDHCLLDARGVAAGQFTIGSHVMIARGTALAAKTDHGSIEIGDHCNLGKNCVVSSSGGVRLGRFVGVGDMCFLGGGRYATNRADLPMMQQEMWSEGAVEIGDDCWIGTGAIVLDGVRIGRGSVIGAGAVVREDVPELTVVAPHQRLVMLPRKLDVIAAAARA